jgi:hypothetical protein
MAFNVFISWSGARSHKVARALAVWLKEVNQSIETLISEKIPAGAEFFTELTGMLKQADFAVIVVTPENWNNPWISLEPGIIMVKGAQVCPYMIDLSSRRRDLPEPLKFFQAKMATYEGTHELVRDINAAAGSPLTELQLKEIFDKKWPELEAVIKEVNFPGDASGKPASPPPPPNPKDCSDDFMRVSGFIQCHQDRLYGVFHDLIYTTADTVKVGKYDRETVVRMASREIEKSKNIYSKDHSLLVGSVADFFAEHFKLAQLVAIIQKMEGEIRPKDFDEKGRFVGDLGALQRKWVVHMRAAVSEVFLIFHRALLDKLGECNKRAGLG